MSASAMKRSISLFLVTCVLVLCLLVGTKTPALAASHAMNLGTHSTSHVSTLLHKDTYAGPPKGTPGPKHHGKGHQKPHQKPHKTGGTTHPRQHNKTK
ncbi:hypothetical protein KSC_042270 [Ktedonobacter sp. SOSP1-52]|uniref:hypothetical protein n=1 Tax=Ktedonobacter sp. SOSP1-52 TaxID=2778366 RepID=UPI001916AA0C|nr:hypothetical protein [Ktedonobacter sp. SOSP1-52]GHO65335.1 hypothetical protein KSC_042270 [Ktedonobacter sp. SOSP1-52]